MRIPVLIGQDLIPAGNVVDPKLLYFGSGSGSGFTFTFGSGFGAGLRFKRVFLNLSLLFS